MSKILDVNNMLDAASECDLPDRDLYVEKFEALATELGEALALHLGIKVTHSGDYQHGFAGLCVNFGPATPGQPCPEVIHEGDPGGDWENISDFYPDNKCPDCREFIPLDATFGDACGNCGHVFVYGEFDDEKQKIQTGEKTQAGEAT